MTAMEEEEEEDQGNPDGEDEFDSVLVGRDVTRSGGREKMRIKMERAKMGSRDRSMVPDTQYEAVESDDSGAGE